MDVEIEEQATPSAEGAEAPDGEVLGRMIREARKAKTET